MQAEVFVHQIKSMRDCIAVIHQKANQLPLLPQNLLEESFKELCTTLEKLQVMQEELLQQNEELVATRLAVEAQRQRYQELFNFAPDAYLVTDAGGTIQEVNCTAATLLSFSQKSVVGKPLVCLVPLENRNIFRSQLNQLANKIGSVQEWKVRLSPRKGKFFDAALRVAVFQDRENGLVSLRWLVRDITPAKLVEKALQTAKQQLEIKIEERTAQLRSANDQLQREIAERQQVEEALKQAKQQLAIKVQERTDELKAANDQLLSEVAERKQAEMKLEQSLSLLRGTLEATADGIIVSQNGKHIVTVNQKFVNMWGIPEAVIASQDLNFVLPLILDQLKEPEAFLRQTQDFFSQPNAEGYGIFELKDGRIFERYSQPQRIGENIVGRVCSFRDITERKQAELELQQSEQKYRNLFHNSLVGMFRNTLDDGTVLDANGAILKMFGFASYEGVKAVDLYVNPPDREILKQLLKEKGFVENFEAQVRRQDNSVFWISYSGKLYLKEGYWEGVIIDITKRKFAEESLRKANDHLEIKVEERTAQLRQAITRFQEVAIRESLLNRLASAIRNSLDLDITLETAVQEIYNHLEIDSCVFAWYRPDDSLVSWDVIKQAKNAELPSYLGLYSLADWRPFTDKLINRELFRVDNVTEGDETVQQMLSPFNMAAVLSLPIETQSGQLGAITCSRLVYRQPWTAEEVELLQAVANQLAIGINQAQLYEQSRIAATIAQTKATQLEVALFQLQQAQAQLVQSEKMSSLGQLVAGVAHEINNPLNFIHGNLVHVNEYAIDLLNLIQLYEKYYSHPALEIKAETEVIDVNFIKEDLPKLLKSMSIGAERIRQIVLSLRNFSRLDEADKKEANIHEGLDNTLLILANRLKAPPLPPLAKGGTHPGIQVIKEYGDLPIVLCYPGQLNQVFMNILSNAIDALEESVVSENTTDKQPIIQIRTEVNDSNSVIIRIADNGSGMTKGVQRKIFDPFFTTKPVGQGTGLGMSISYQIVVERHGGQLQFISAPGQGTEFLISLPIEQKKSSCLSKKRLVETCDYETAIAE